MVAGALILFDIVEGFVEGFTGGSAAVDPPACGSSIGVLLLLIIAELLYTLQLVVARGEIATEPFLSIGIIAVVRRVVVITAEIESSRWAGVR